MSKPTEHDYRVAVAALVYGGFKPKKLKQMIDIVAAERKEEREEAMADYEMGRGPYPK